MTYKRVFLKVTGIVQGVGFRPFVYNLAISLNLKGWVNNNSEGVYIDIEGPINLVDEFIHKLKHNAPSLSRVENINLENRDLCCYKDFEIRESERNENSITLISPDIALCDDCKRDILDPKDRRYSYPFTNCTNCGPRFSIIKSIPYDRDKTTMKKFKMCISCEGEYRNPLDRRFHAQPNACKDCGPNIWITDSNNNIVKLGDSNTDIIKFAVSKLKEGKIFVIKGLTGFHLCCDAGNETSIKHLRQRKIRPDKPFAIMVKDLGTAKKLCHINSKEEELLTGIKKPIVLLKQRKEYQLSKAIAPNQNTLGVMLPYTPLHELIFKENVDALIMTSANINGLPLEYENNSALKNLSSIGDYFLFHNRDIYIPVDDSVVKVINDEERIVRRARGYAPEPIKYESIENILACGPNMKNTFSIGKDNFIFLSQHNGDLENLETIEHYKRNIEHFKNIFSFVPKYLAYDLHPQYSSTQYAGDYNLRKIGIQHHHAHITSCMAENKINHKIIGVSFDGTGYGTDGKIWGGEFLLCDLLNFERLGHLDHVKMPGGEMAIKEPWRMAVSYITKAFSNLTDIKSTLNLEDTIKKIYGEDGLVLIKIINKDINSPETSSMGRFFDAVSSIIGIRNIITYEGQASIELEAAIKGDINERYSYEIIENKGSFIIETYKLILQLIEDRLAGVPKSTMSSKFHNSVIQFTHELCCVLKNKTGVNEVALSGGVFQNSYLLGRLIKILEADNFIVYTHKTIPSNDGGIALGQIASANEILKKNY
jgi:hydrogenase maturation protein HypF